jgi:hypothetical protein
VTEPSSAYIAALFCLGLLGVAVLWSPSAAKAGEKGLIEGQVLDASCFDSCDAPTHPAGYRGEGRIVVTRVVSTRTVAIKNLKSRGRFRIRVSRGRYELTFQSDDPCFQDITKQLRVSAGGDIDRPELTRNCLVMS